ncbi:MAG TPA: lipoate--protein ligase [Bacteroidetes bacterium]|nr:lipoate--protein ligase [Candidatus Limimorpha avicola]
MNPILQIIIGNQYSPYLNLSVESFLLDTEKENTVTMFLWKNHKTVVIGTNQNPYSECDVNTLLAEGGHLARRRTGGGAVYHDLGNINFSFIAAKKLYDVKKQMSVIQRALQYFGLETEISGRNDITYQNRKFSGNAFAFTKSQGLHHGTILIRTDDVYMQKYLKVNPAKLQKHGVKSVTSRIINLSEVCDITSDNIIPYLILSFKEIYNNDVVTLDFNYLCNNDVISNSKILASDKYLYGKWKDFHTKKSAQYEWGWLDMDINIDESTGTISHLALASDSLQPEAINEAQNLLLNASTKMPPPVPDSRYKNIIEDIFKLVY